MHNPNPPVRRGARALLLIAACAAVFATSDAVAATAPMPSPAAIAAQRTADNHLSTRRVSPRDLPPIGEVSRTAFDYNLSPHADSRPAPPAVRQACDFTALANATDAAFVSAVRASPIDCVNGDLFAPPADQALAIFGEAKMIAVANAMQGDAATYPGDNTHQMRQLVMFLRAGYYVQWQHRDEPGWAYTGALKSAAGNAIAAFGANSHFLDVNEGHGVILGEVITLIHSSHTFGQNVGLMRRLLDAYGPSFSGWAMRNSITSAHNVLYNGRDDAEFQAAVRADPQIIVSLANLIINQRNDLGDPAAGYPETADAPRQYILIDSVRELTRFTDAAYGATRDVGRAQVKRIIDQFPLVGRGGVLKVVAASVVDPWNYDEGNCSYYGVCGFHDELDQNLLAAPVDCGTSIRIRAQGLTPSQLTSACQTMQAEENFFHTKLQTNRQPVANDNNAVLEVVVFNTADDYRTYSYVMFGNATNNGGIYLEGDPAAPGNVPRFFCYEVYRAWGIWNLTHEYVHYLDGRFNMHGNFCNNYPTGDRCGVPTAPRESAVWYMEGIAEYIAFSFANEPSFRAPWAALNEDADLARVLRMDYDSSNLYGWGYLATRYLFEHQREKFDAVVSLFRAGSYVPGYGNWQDAIGTSLNGEFANWVDCYLESNGDMNGQCVPDRLFQGTFDPPPPAPECTSSDPHTIEGNCRRSNIASSTSTYFWVWVPGGSQVLTVLTSEGTGNADIYVGYNRWTSPTDFDARSIGPDNTENLTIYAPAMGWWHIHVKAQTAFTGLSVFAKVE
ncbi:M9 family metallopeptidase [Tahibacter amnicola]|uniref:microbial collagenase n=1 Tax=Tahibacter amnicola TaxID=2976241 RepID=A0ABY6BJ45_9GAMM|nr:M9 family metallopeptidase [Tahibacter amnicola]UXI69782.1 M9 family metallopeptidase [Tahibacter amnicola]